MKKLLANIADLIADGYKRFAIYPYGENGIKLESYLKRYFDLQPIYIIDNEYCKYNRRIINIADFEKVYEMDRDIVVILTAENPYLNAKLRQGLAKFIDETNVLNIALHWNGFLTIETLPPPPIFREFPSLNEKDTNLHNQTHLLRKIRILHTSDVAWNNIKTLCEACVADETIDLLLVLNDDRDYGVITDAHRESDLSKYPSVWKKDYKVYEDYPDVFIIVATLYVPDMKVIRFYSRCIVILSIALVKYFKSDMDFVRSIDNSFGDLQPDFYIFDSYLYKTLKMPERICAKCVELGHPKYDGIYKALKNKENCRWGDKLHGRKVFLWVTTHGIYRDSMKSRSILLHERVTFDIYINYILDYFTAHKDIALIFRPHPSLLHELVHFDIYSEQDIRQIKTTIEQLPNAVFDDSISYDTAYAFSDALICDDGCGMLLSYLPTEKPVCVLHRSSDATSYEPDIESCYYSAHDEDELGNYLESICNDVDPKRHLRREAVKRYVNFFDGHNGERVKEFLKNI